MLRWIKYAHYLGDPPAEMIDGLFQMKLGGVCFKVVIHFSLGEFAAWRVCLIWGCDCDERVF